MVQIRALSQRFFLNMVTQVPSSNRARIQIAAALLSAAATSVAAAQTYSASDSVFSPTSWTASVVGDSATRAGSASQVVDGYAAGSNAWQSSLSPGGTGLNAWVVSIFEGFAYSPTSTEAAPDVSISFDSRWVSVTASRVGPAMRQGSTIWAGSHPLNNSSWSTYSFLGWTSILAGTDLGMPDLSPGAAPIYFGFYQRNGGPLTGIQSEFANFSVTVTATPVPAPPMLLSIVALSRIAGSRFAGPGRRRA
jgi:hypothetical protein